ncbi:ferric reductase-like transmembrane domain-containing protein [Paenibacillus thermotolerans]|uniref:ferric reductase-like transmembrane domain-containing protein n=1 Tax=Paenibacillus thermotolerans TaxID=3027807 RepID=UPI0023679109|nr:MULTISPECIES: ferric reductase-like transmembrane domain-containing protein [unclassified Paenibacillus]
MNINEWMNALSVWSATRAAGLTAYLLLFVSTAAGITMSLKLLSGKAKSALLTLHQSSGWFGFLFGIVHGSVLLFDRYVGYTPSELLIPFTTRSHAFLNGLGILSFYIAFILLLSSDLMKKLGKKLWRSIHYLAFPGFFMSLLHGVLLGTDTPFVWAKLVYIGTAGMIVILTLFRVAAVSFEKKPESSAPAGRAYR